MKFFRSLSTNFLDFRQALEKCILSVRKRFWRFFFESFSFVFSCSDFEQKLSKLLKLWLNCFSKLVRKLFSSPAQFLRESVLFGETFFSFFDLQQKLLGPSSKNFGRVLKTALASPEENLERKHTHSRNLWILVTFEQWAKKFETSGRKFSKTLSDLDSTCPGDHNDKKSFSEKNKFSIFFEIPRNLFGLLKRFFGRIIEIVFWSAKGCFGELYWFWKLCFFNLLDFKLSISEFCWNVSAG